MKKRENKQGRRDIRQEGKEDNDGDGDDDKQEEEKKRRRRKKHDK